MNEETSLITFKAICNFVNNLETVHGDTQKSLKLYKRLLNKTQISHTRAMNKHINIFRNFCLSNRGAILEKDYKKFTHKKLIYSDNVFVNLYNALESSDSETANAIWQHILTISALTDPVGKAKEILKKNAEEDKSIINEADFLTNIISKVEKTVKPDSNPMEAVNSIMQSGVFTELLSGMQGGLNSGQLDIGKLLGAVQGMVSNLGEQVGDDPQAKQSMSMLTSMVGNLQNGEEQSPPDMIQMMSMMMSGMNNMNNQEEKK